MNILVIPEDFRYDQYILKPLFERLFRNRRSVRVLVCQDPLLGGVREALKSERIAEIMDKYEGMVQIFILCVDRDGELGRRDRLDQLESEFGSDVPLLAENAWEEIETWALAGLDLPNDWRWEDIRAEVNVKELYFDELARQRGLLDSSDRGRKVLGAEAARSLSAIRQKCSEDFNELANRLTSSISRI